MNQDVELVYDEGGYAASGHIFSHAFRVGQQVGWLSKNGSFEQYKAVSRAFANFVRTVSSSPGHEFMALRGYVDGVESIAKTNLPGLEGVRILLGVPENQLRKSVGLRELPERDGTGRSNT